MYACTFSRQSIIEDDDIVWTGSEKCWERRRKKSIWGATDVVGFLQLRHSYPSFPPPPFGLDADFDLIPVRVLTLSIEFTVEAFAVRRGWKVRGHYIVDEEEKKDDTLEDIFFLLQLRLLSSFSPFFTQQNYSAARRIIRQERKQIKSNKSDDSHPDWRMNVCKFYISFQNEF